MEFDKRKVRSGSCRQELSRRDRIATAGVAAKSVHREDELDSKSPDDGGEFIRLAIQILGAASRVLSIGRGFAG